MFRPFLWKDANKMKKEWLVSVAAAMLAMTTIVSCDVADRSVVDTKNDSGNSSDVKTGPFGFTPIKESVDSKTWDATTPWKLPEGFTQSIVFSEKDSKIYDAGRNDWPDMNTVNESGKMAGRFLYRTHELRNQPEGGAVSVMDLKTGKAKILVQAADLNAIDGIRWTPWGTVLFAEEKKGGRLFETILNDDMMSAARVDARPAVGLLAHEGIEVDSAGNVYVIDEHRGRSVGCDGRVPCGGSIYKFVPKNYGDLSVGELFVLKVAGADGTGQGEWVGPVDPANARISGSKQGGQSYQRPEDIEIIGSTLDNEILYVAITEGPRDAQGKELYEGRVISINLKTLTVANFIKPGINVPVEIGKPGKKNFQSGWDSIDNLAQTADGKLVAIEDNSPSDIWIATTDTTQQGASKGVWHFASLSDPRAEGTGIYFGKDSHTLFVNVQHSAAPDGDATWAITRKSPPK